MKCKTNTPQNCTNIQFKSKVWCDATTNNFFEMMFPCTNACQPTQGKCQ